MKKQDVAKLLGVSRPTLDKIIKDRRIEKLDEATVYKVLGEMIEEKKREIGELKEVQLVLKYMINEKALR